MRRDVSSLSNNVFDLVIVGGGINGAAAAWDAASRGLSVALLDKGDFGSQNSSNSQKIIHGGLRYMQHGDFWRMRKSAYERKILMRIAPHLVHPMPCFIPIYGSFMKSVMPLALKIYDLISFGNSLKDPQKHIPNGKVISKNEILKLIPGVQEDGLTGGVMWYDCQVYNTERLVLYFIESAERAGAVVANYVEVIDLLKDGNCVKGVKGKDLLNDSEVEVNAKVILNATGPWVDNLPRMVKPDYRRNPLSKLLVLIINRPLVQNYAFGISFQKKFKDTDAFINKGYRLLFISPWRNHSLVGTAQKIYIKDPNEFKVTENDICDFIEEVNEAYPYAALTRKDVTFFYGGLVLADEIKQNYYVNIIKNYKIHDHIDENINGLISINGVKYTEGRYVAQKAIDIVFQKLGIKSPKCITMDTPVLGGTIEKFDEFLKNVIKQKPHALSEQTIKSLVYNYGSKFQDILKYIDEDKIWGESVFNKSDVIKAEIIYGVREEMAQKLADVILRRTELGTIGYPGEEVLKVCASIMAKELGWDEFRIQKELEEVKEIYKPGNDSE